MDLNTLFTEQVRSITASLTSEQMKNVKRNAIIAAALTIAYYKLSK